MSLTKTKKQLNQKICTVLKKLGIEYEEFSDNIYATCPVHENSDNPRAFSYSKDKGIWKCWTRDCQQEYKNDVFGLIQGALSLQAGHEINFKQVMSWISSNFNIDKRSYSTKLNQLEDKNTEEYLEFSNIVQTLTGKNKIKTDEEVDNVFDTNEFSEYFEGRGFKKKTLAYFGVKDCYSKGAMQERAVIPIHNEDGNCTVGFIGRSIKEYKIPKFLIYPKGFEKRFYLYNYHRAKTKANETSCLFLLEGQGDVWKLYEAGVLNAVSIFGKTISEQQEEKLRKLAITHIIVLMDNDQAGREARIQIQRQLGRMYTLIFPQITKKDIGEMKISEIKKQILENYRGKY